MQFRGTIKTWKDDRGFGFIEPAQGGQEVFVHIKSFGRTSMRPQPGQQVIFEVEMGRDGKRRAKNVELFDPKQPNRASKDDSPAGALHFSYYAIPAFALLYLGVASIWRVSGWVAVLYVIASAVCFVMYALDKWAATEGRWRISEETLILAGLIGGWPGAIVAQQVFRHKSSKASFRAAFWGSVAINVVAFVALHIWLRNPSIGAA
jgi:uncharacterized membrane protein YsdA (DUF1294 family)/cold shock CspA family protein